MIANVVGSYLDTLEEREFDAPFIALLRALGFWDIHFLHGSFEFGKDFIAKGSSDGIVRQYAFQTKAGNLNHGDWRRARGQIDELRTNVLAHPSFDKGMPRQAVFVTTGRLVGGAPAAAQDYRSHLESMGELGLVVWDREDLVGFMSSTPEVGLAGKDEGELLKILGQIDSNELDEVALERFSRRWFVISQVAGLWRSAIETATIANRLRRSERLDLACYASLCLVRAAWVCAHGQQPPNNVSLAVANLGRSLFRHYALDLWERCGEEPPEALDLIHAHEPLTSFVTYPVRCTRLAETLGLLGLLELETEEPTAPGIANYLVKFRTKNPGLTHPISDHWAVSMIPPALFLTRSGRKREVESFLLDLVRWTGDCYEHNRFGLAGPRANPEEEVNHLLGAPFEHVTLERRPESYISTIVLDLAAVLEMSELYQLARNDFLAVDAMSCVMEVDDTVSQYLVDASDLNFEPNMEYKENWHPVDRWKVAPHHSRGPSSYYLSRIGRIWDHLALSIVLRDRHFPTTWRQLVDTKAEDPNGPSYQ